MNDKQKVDIFNTLFMSGSLDPLIVCELILSYKLTAELDDVDSQELMKALRIVIKHYTTVEQYEKFIESVKDTIYLSIDELEQGELYFCDARNFTFGEWNGNSFVYKHQARANHTYYDTEYHYDRGAPFGTVKPFRKATKEEKIEFYC